MVIKREKSSLSIEDSNPRALAHHSSYVLFTILPFIFRISLQLFLQRQWDEDFSTKIPESLIRSANTSMGRSWKTTGPRSNRNFWNFQERLEQTVVQKKITLEWYVIYWFQHSSSWSWIANSIFKIPHHGPHSAEGDFQCPVLVSWGFWFIPLYLCTLSCLKIKRSWILIMKKKHISPKSSKNCNEKLKN